MARPSYSIVIPYHSNVTFLKICLESLIETIPPEVEIIVVLNNSDKTGLDVEIDETRVRAIRIAENLGYAKATNLGAREATGDYLFFCDADTYFLSGWFEKACECFHSSERIGIVGIKLLNPETNRIIDFGIGLTKYNNCHPFLDRPHDFNLTRSNRRVQMVCSAVMLIERDMFFKLGGNDENLLNFYTDVDLCLKLKDHDKECWVVWDAYAYHQGDSTALGRAPYRTDIKGFFVANNLHRMSIDMDTVFEEGFEEWFKHNTPAKSYLFADFSSIADREWYLHLLKQYLEIHNSYQFGSKVRDARHISLMQNAGSNLLLLKQPILYFVDRFLSLRDNHLWSLRREGMGDLVVDRHGNIVAFDKIKEA